MSAKKEGALPAHAEGEDDDDDDAESESSSEASLPSIPSDSEASCSDDEQQQLQQQHDPSPQKRVVARPADCRRMALEALSTMEIHPLHLFNPGKPCCMPGCRTAHHLVDAARSDPGLNRPLQRARCELEGESLDARSLKLCVEDWSVSVPLCFAEAASAPVPGNKGTSVIAIVPATTLPSLNTRRMARRAATVHLGDKDDELPSMKDLRLATSSTHCILGSRDCQGWLLLCQTAAVCALLGLLTSLGCCLSGLSKVIRLELAMKILMGSHASVVRGFSHDTTTHAFACIAGHDQDVAVKLLKLTVKPNQMKTEVEMLLCSQGHPSIIKFHGIFFDRDEVPLPRHRALIFEFHEQDLKARVNDGRRLLQNDALRMFKHLLLALSHIHKRGVFHRDVKPDNILVARDNRLVLADFGSATRLSDIGGMMRPSYTIGFCSPEVLSGCASGNEGDAFSAGVVLYFMLSKTTPFLAPTAQGIIDRTQDCKVDFDDPLLEHMSSDCQDLINGLICKEAKQRLTVDQALEMPCFFRLHCAPVTQPELPSFSLKPGRRANMDVDKRPEYPLQMTRSKSDLAPIDGSQYMQRTIPEDDEYIPSAETFRDESEKKKSVLEMSRRRHAMGTCGDLPALSAVGVCVSGTKKLDQLLEFSPASRAPSAETRTLASSQSADVGQ